MLCPLCYGKHFVTVNGRRVPCPECAGAGEVHCCDGLQEQPAADPAATDWLTFGLLHLIGGLCIGVAVGVGAQRGFRRLHLPSPSSYPILALALAGLAYGVATELGSSGFRAARQPCSPPRLKIPARRH